MSYYGDDGPPSEPKTSEKFFKAMFRTASILTAAIITEKIISYFLPIPMRFIQDFFLVLSGILCGLSLYNFSGTNYRSLIRGNQATAKYNQEVAEKHWDENMKQYINYPRWHYYDDPGYFLVLGLAVHTLWFFQPYFWQFVF